MGQVALVVDGGKLEVWDPLTQMSSPLCCVSANNTAVVQIVVRLYSSVSSNSKRIYIMSLHGTVSARVGVGHLLLPAQLPGTH